MKKINLPIIYSQWDTRWNNELLGFNTVSPFNIHNYGCLITCLAMVSRYYGYKFDPKIVNDKLKKIGGFVGGGNYVWGGLSQIAKGVTELLTNTPSLLTDARVGEIKDALDSGYPVMVQIDYNPKTVKNDMHYVLLTGYNPEDENDFTIVDPLGGVEKSLKEYLGWFRMSARITIEQYIVFKGKVPQNSNLSLLSIDFDDPEGNRHEVGWYVYEWSNEKTNRIKENEQKDEVIKGLEERLAGLNKLYTEYKENTDKLLKKTTSEKDKIDLEFNKLKEKYARDINIYTKKVDDLNTEIDQKNIRIEELIGGKEITVPEAFKIIWMAIKDVKTK